MSDDLHGDIAPEDPLPPAAGGSKEERNRKAAERRRLKKEQREKRARRAAERRAAKVAADDAAKKDAKQPAADDAGASAPSSEGGASDDEWSRWVKEEMERPLQGPNDLAVLLGKLQMTAVGLAQGTVYEDAAWSLQWTNGKDPLPRCSMAARMMWPWMKRNGYDGVVLAEQADTLLMLIGVVVLVGPSIGPLREAMKKAKAEREAKAAEEAKAKNRTIGTELLPNGHDPHPPPPEAH